MKCCSNIGDYEGDLFVIRGYHECLTGTLGPRHVHMPSQGDARQTLTQHTEHT